MEGEERSTVAQWRKCESCNKVKAVEQFDEDSAACRECLTKPVRRPRAAAAEKVTTRPAPVRRPPADVRGTGDVEVRLKRARRRATDRLIELHAEEFEELLTAERRAEGLR
jgi:hypothetical protein